MYDFDPDEASAKSRRANNARGTLTGAEDKDHWFNTDALITLFEQSGDHA